VVDITGNAKSPDQGGALHAKDVAVRDIFFFFIDILGPPIEIALQMLSVSIDNREIIRLHLLGSRVPDLDSVQVAVAGGLQTVVRSGLFQSPRPPVT